MTNIQKMYMQRAVMIRIEWCRENLTKTTPGSPTDKALIEEVSGLQDAIFEVTGARSFEEFLEMVNE